MSFPLSCESPRKKNEIKTHKKIVSRRREAKKLLRQYWMEFIRMTWQWNFLNALWVNKVIMEKIPSVRLVKRKIVTCNFLNASTTITGIPTTKQRKIQMLRRIIENDIFPVDFTSTIIQDRKFVCCSHQLNTYQILSAFICYNFYCHLRECREVWMRRKSIKSLLSQHGTFDFLRA